MIQGAIVTPLRVMTDERGRLMEMYRSDDPNYLKFGQTYMTTAYPGVVKAWHYHKKQVDNFIVVHGMLKVVLFDSREDSPTKGEVNEFFLGIHNPVRLTIPNLVYHGFKCISEHEAICINVPSELYNYKEPDEYRLPAHTPEIPYDWGRMDK
jgi:dTDP-4-dehydrorhamnose 3,5-epimerase